MRQLLGEYGIEPRRYRSQNFLIDGNVLRRIVAAAELGPNDVVLEVGPGPGVLTERLMAAGAVVWAVEIDPQLAVLLAERFGNCPRFHLIRQDFLTLAWPDLWEQMGQPPTAKVVANIPYSITSPLLIALGQQVRRWERVVLLVQKEVADRLTAGAGSKAYGALTVAIRARFQVERLSVVPPTVFWPAPHVQSAVVRLFPLTCPLDEGVEEVFRKLTRAAFGQRRKMLRTSLGSLAIPPPVWAQTGIDATRRGETLPPEEFAALARALAGYRRLGTPAQGKPPDSPRQSAEMGIEPRNEGKSDGFRKPY